MMLALATSASAVTRLSLVSTFGGDVNQTETGKGASFEDICTVASGNTCQKGATTSTVGGWFKGPRSVAVNETTGNVYIADERNARVQEFTASGAFIRAWGWNVVASGPDAKGNFQAVAVNATAGTYTLSFSGQTTSAINYNASGAEVRAALETLSTVGPGNVTVTGGPGGSGALTPYIVTFGGSLAANQPLMIASPSGLTSGTKTVTVGYGFQVCNPAVGDVCQAGTKGPGEGEFGEAISLSVDNSCHEQDLSGNACTSEDPSNGDVFVVDPKEARVDKFTSEGAFVLLFGGEVNETAHEHSETANENICPVSSIASDKCKAGVKSTAVGSFEGLNTAGEYSAVHSTGSTVSFYVGDQSRLQEFDPSGVAKAFGSLVGPLGTSAKVQALAVDRSGNVYVKGSVTGGVHELEPKVVTGKPEELEFTQLQEFAASNTLVSSVTVLDSLADVAVGSSGTSPHGALYDPLGTQLSTFSGGTSEGALSGMIYNNVTGDVYAVDATDEDARIYQPIVLPTAITAGTEKIEPTTAMLLGEIDPEGVDASSFFEYGPCEATCAGTRQYGNEKVAIQTSAGPNPRSPDDGSGLDNVPVEAGVNELQPNKEYHYRLVGTNKPGDPESNEFGAEQTFKTLPAPPVIEGGLKALFVTPTDAELEGLVNAENYPTTYIFEYGPCGGSCAGSSYPHRTLSNSAGEGFPGSRVFGHVEGLEPDTTYHFRMSATGDGTVLSNEGTFTTPEEEPIAVLRPKGAPEVGRCTVVGAGTEAATISGEIEPNGSQASYFFEVGANGVQWSIVASGQIGEAEEKAHESDHLANLSPGMRYECRITAMNSQGAKTGGVGIFETSPAPIGSLIAQAPAQTFLPTPLITLPTVEKGAATKATAQQKALAKCKKKRHRKQRLACERSVRKQLGKRKK